MTEPAQRRRKGDVSGYHGPNGDWRPGASTGAGVGDVSHEGLYWWLMGLGVDAGQADPHNDTRNDVIRRAIVEREKPSKMGTFLHDCMERGLEGGDWHTVFDVELEHPGSGEHWKAALAFIEDHGPDPFLTEATCHHLTKPISGTGDFLGHIEGLEGLTWADWKFSKKTSLICSATRLKNMPALTFQKQGQRTTQSRQTSQLILTGRLYQCRGSMKTKISPCKGLKSSNNR